ncbi:MAG: bifunctional glycosyltransferase family 2/GtrA family protein [Peptostreptococcaceae bacterium]|nr:bifunctional glycosyltransferase family 2/GtrA family protein [Peptostreptococcaceae bacterium]
MKPVVIIPAFNPDEKLIKLVEQLTKMEFQIIVVNDGSGQECRRIFDMIKAKYQCDLCNHSENMGKGAAIKTGIQYADINYPECSGYVTADADGQHLPEDILRVANSLEMNPDSLILGTRDFRKNGIPLKSFLGNRITSLVYFLSTGKKCIDTQTGLRGISRKFTELSLSVSGDKYEYEMNLLLTMGHMGILFIEVPIAVIYLEENKSSHFNPVKDSIIIYLNIFKYSFSSFLSAIIDISLFTVFVNLVFGSGHIGILEATAAARLVAGGVNFLLNKHWVFQSKKHNWEETLKYFTLFGFQILVSWLLVTSLKHLPVNITLIKIFVDVTLFFISFQIQKTFVFNKKN